MSLDESLRGLIGEGSRVVIIGGPKTGKTTLYELLKQLSKNPGVFWQPASRKTDDLMDTLDWSGVSQEASNWLGGETPFLFEGVAMVRALRKWLERNPSGSPCDLVIYAQTPHEELSRGQHSMTVGHETVWRGIEEDLLSRGVKVLYLRGSEFFEG